MAKPERKWKRRGAGQWQELVERQAEGGQSVETFCRSESISTASFYRWRKQLWGTSGGVERTVTGGLAAPSLEDLGALGGSGGWELELTLGGGVVLRLRGG